MGGYIGSKPFDYVERTCGCCGAVKQIRAHSITQNDLDLLGGAEQRWNQTFGVGFILIILIGLISAITVGMNVSPDHFGKGLLLVYGIMALFCCFWIPILLNRHRAYLKARTILYTKYNLDPAKVGLPDDDTKSEVIVVE